MGWWVGLEGHASLLLECHLLILEEFWWEIRLHCWKPGHIEQGSLLRLIFLHYIPHFLSLHFSSRVHWIRWIARKDIGILILIYFIIHILPWLTHPIRCKKITFTISFRLNFNSGSLGFGSWTQMGFPEEFQEPKMKFLRLTSIFKLRCNLLNLFPSINKMLFMPGLVAFTPDGLKDMMQCFLKMRTHGSELG